MTDPVIFILCTSPSPRCALEKSTVSDGPHGHHSVTGLPLPPKIAYGPAAVPKTNHHAAEAE